MPLPMSTVAGAVRLIAKQHWMQRQTCNRVRDEFDIIRYARYARLLLKRPSKPALNLKCSR
jgi:hypothetical protein